MSNELMNAALAFYEEHAKLVSDETGNSGKSVWSVNATDHKKFFKKNGIPEETMKRITEIDAALINAGTKFLSTKTVAAVKAAKKAGEDPKQVKVILKTANASGRTVMTMDSYRKYHSPRPDSQGKTIEAHGVVTLRVINNRLIDTDCTAEAAKAVAAAI